MDMDYDIPLPEELESLEANSYFHDDHDFYPDLDLPEQHPPDSPPSFDPLINGHNKRPRSDSPDSPRDDTQLPSDKKRTKIVDLDDVEEDWSRYSPPPLAVGTEDVRVVGEKILSSYAFEIDWECMPVTARGGDRVYAKMSRFETEERVKNFHFLCMPLSHASSHFGGSRLAGLIMISLSKNPRCLDGAAVTVLIIASIYDAVGSIIIGNLLGLFHKAARQKDDSTLLKSMADYGEEPVTVLESEVNRLKREIREINLGIQHVVHQKITFGFLRDV